MKVIFFGSGSYVIPIVEKLRDKGLVFVVTSEPSGELTNYLNREKIPILYSNLKSFEDIFKIESLEPTLGILASFGAILPKEIIDLFPLGILNIHPSLLPKYKGPSPVQTTILNGDLETGVTIIKLDDQVDHGPIVAQEKLEVNGTETFQDLTKLLFFRGSEMIEKVIQKVHEGNSIEEKPQRINSEKFTKKITREDGKIDLSNPMSSVSRLILDRKIRAYYPWPGVYLTTSLGNSDKLIKLLPNKMVQVEGRKPMNYKDFINGYGKDASNLLIKLGLQ